MYAQAMNRLKLEAGADERTIKRAYARELKLIDQVQDAAGFQALREAYEAALYWFRHGSADVFNDDAEGDPSGDVLSPEARAVDTPAGEARLVDSSSAAPPVVPRGAPAVAESAAQPRAAESGDDPAQLADEVFQGFLAACAEMAATGQSRDAEGWKRRLIASLTHDNLINISARAIFESMLAHLLANGWRPGHEGLFVAAREIFNWDADRRRVLEFGRAGTLLNQAIDECDMFPHQSPIDRAGQKEAILRLRDAREPDRQELLTLVPHLRLMCERFPCWTSVIGDTYRLRDWDQREQEIPAEHRRVVGSANPVHDSGVAPSGTSSNDSGSSFRWWHFVLFLLLIKMLVSMAGSGTPTPDYSRYDRSGAETADAGEEAYKQAAGRFYIPPGQRKLDPSLMGQSDPIPVNKRDLNSAELNEIFLKVEYTPQSGKKGNRYKVQYRLELKENGAVDRLDLTIPSGLPKLDKAVATAIRAAAPYNDDVRRSSLVTLGFVHQGWKDVPASDKARERAAAAAAEARAPFEKAERDAAMPRQETPEPAAE